MPKTNTLLKLLVPVPAFTASALPLNVGLEGLWVIFPPVAIKEELLSKVRLTLLEPLGAKVMPPLSSNVAYGVPLSWMTKSPVELRL